jgi:arsenite methyltransferase
VTSCEAVSPERAAEIRAEIKSKYKAVSVQPEGHFPYPVGRESALKLGYDTKWIEGMPAEVVDRFVGVGNPIRIRLPHRGACVLDIGCGCGMDAFVAASLAGPDGQATGLDLTEEMLAHARLAAIRSGLVNLEFRQGSAESLPFDTAVFDLVISNGVLNLVPDKAAAFSEIARVLRQGGAFAAADLLVIETIPPEVLAGKDAWST